MDGFTVTNGKNAEGGAIVTGSTHIEVLNCRFIGNEATDRAGAWHHEAYGGLPYFRNCQFEDNASPKHGGAGYVKYGSAILEDCVFRENYCSWSGSGIYATGDARLLMLNCTFEDNFGSPVISAGGAALLVIDRCRIADNDGTGVYAPDAFLLRDSEISGNTTDVTGGGLHMDAGTVIRSKIANNVSDSDGGGVTIYNGCATFDDCVISGNRAEEDGGGIYCSGSNCPTFTDCVIEANESYSGGGAYCSRESAATFTHCNISGNYAKVGAGVTCDSSDVSFPKLEGCEVISNIGSSGGGLLVLRSDPDISNTVIAGNVGSIAGGGVWMLESNARLDNVTLSENQAGLGGGIYSALSSPVVYGSILWNDGGEELFGQASVTYSDVQGGNRGIGNINDDPQFVDPGTDYRLTSRSPCVDMGSAGRGRDGCSPPGLGGIAADMGAYGGFDNCVWNCESKTVVAQNPGRVLKGDKLTFWASAVNSCDEVRTIDEALLEVAGPANLTLSLYSGGDLSIQPGATLGTTVKVSVSSNAPAGFYSLRLVTKHNGVEVDDDVFQVAVD